MNCNITSGFGESSVQSIDIEAGNDNSIERGLNVTSTTRNNTTDSVATNNDLFIEYIYQGAINTYLKEIYEFKILSDEDARKPVFTDDVKIDNSVINVVNPGKSKKELLVTEGKSPKQILNEYAQKYLKGNVEYTKLQYKYEIDVIIEISINDIKYGIGKSGTTKKARLEAAISTLNILDPKLLAEKNDEEYSKMVEVRNYFSLHF